MSFRGSLSNPVDDVTVFKPGDRWFGIDADRLPAGSVDYDNIPDGHVSVRGVSPGELKEAVVVRGRLPGN